jgi:N-acyl homoserine lactone hydrolase
VLHRDDIGIHLGSEVVADGETWPGLVHTIDHPLARSAAGGAGVAGPNTPPPAAGGLVLVDTGMIDSTPELDEEWRPTPHPLPAELVSRVAMVVNTHLHFDHCGGNRLFPGVPIHVQRRELLDARTQENYTIPEWVDFEGATYVEHDGEAEILPGVRLLPAPGHTAGHQIVVVETDEGPVVLGGDVGYSFEEIGRGDTPGRQLVLELGAPTYLAHTEKVRVPRRTS